MAIYAQAATFIIGGLLEGNSRAKASRQQREAAGWVATSARYERIQLEQQQAVQRRDLIRTFRAARATAVAQASLESGGLQSSGVNAVKGSLGSQLSGNLNYLTTQAYLGSQAFNARQRAAELGVQAQSSLQQADLIGSYTNLVGTLVGKINWGGTPTPSSTAESTSDSSYSGGSGYSKAFGY